MSSLPSARVLLALHPLLLLLLLGARPGDGARNHWTPREGEEPFCYPFNETCGPITPAVPSRYEAHMEHTDVLNNITHYIEEFYDYEADVLAVTDSFEGVYTHTIFFYAMNRAVLMWSERGVEEGSTPTTCTIFEISHKSWVSPFPGQDNATHLVLAPSQALLFGDNYRYSWVENNTQRGMLCNRWDACITNDLGTFYVEYEWTIPTRVVEVPSYTTERPARMRMTGYVQPPQGTTQPIPVESIYTMGLFEDNPEEENIRWAFEIPSGVYCEGLPAGKSPPDAMSTSYSMRVEVAMQTSASSRQEYMSTVRNWYDYYHKLTRMDSITTPGTVEYEAAGLVQVAVIKDFRMGVEYVVDKALGNCTTLELTDGYDTITTPDGHYTMKDPLLIFGLEGANLTYHGTKYARGLPCDVWVGHFDIEADNGTIHDALLYEVYMLQAGWTEETGQATNKPVPILIKVFQDLTIGQLPEDLIENLEENIFKFKEEAFVFAVFDITPCFIGHDHIRRFQMAFPSTYRQYYDEQPARFMSWVHNGLYIQLQIPPIRLQQLEIEFVESYDRLFCEFTLVDVPQVDMDLPPYVGKPLDEVVQLLKNSMNDIAIVILDDNNNPLLMRPYNDSLREMFEEGCYSRDAPFPPLPNMGDHHPAPLNIPSPRHLGGVGDGDVEDLGLVDSAAWAEMQQLTRSNDEKMYSPGDMAGMAMGMLVLGLLFGTVLMLAFLKKMGLSNGMEFIPMNSRRQ